MRRGEWNTRLDDADVTVIEAERGKKKRVGRGEGDKAETGPWR
jgi:hypothetical protein